jgi:hypothetical protein
MHRRRASSSGTQLKTNEPFFKLVENAFFEPDGRLPVQQGRLWSIRKNPLKTFFLNSNCMCQKTRAV